MGSEPPLLAQTTTLPPAQPTYVLRGHQAQIHAVHFLKENLRLVSGDADGWVILWNLPIKRPVAVWRAHSNAILGLGSWQTDKIITHGRDNKLHVWQLRKEDESTFSTKLPVEDAESDRKQPWLLHSLDVNALNFCSFAMSQELPTDNQSILIATPGVQDGWINVTSLPSEERLATIATPKDIKTGMVMAIRLQYQNNQLLVLAGYESGHVAVWQQHTFTKHWQTTYVNKVHSQPILSLDAAVKLDCFFTSSADAIIARHPFSLKNTDSRDVKTKHAGQQSLSVRSDERIFATAGWDGRVRVYSCKSMKELAVLKWHKEGCYAVTFAEISQSDSKKENGVTADDSLTKHDLTVSEQRVERAKSTHWLAAGSKDGKVSLWEIY